MAHLSVITTPKNKYVFEIQRKIIYIMQKTFTNTKMKKYN